MSTSCALFDTIDGEDLNELLGFYLFRVPEESIIQENEPLACLALPEILKSEISELAGIGKENAGSLEVAVSQITEFVVVTAAAAMSHAPREAAQQIADALTGPKSSLRTTIADAKKSSAKRALGDG